MHIIEQSELDGMPCPDTLIHGDCLEAMKHIADGSVDMILADLPYGTTQCKWDSVIPFAPLWEAYKRVIKPNGAIVLTASQPFTSALVMSNPQWFRYEWIWQKNMASNAQLANRQPMKKHESVLVFSCKPHIYNPLGTIPHVRNPNRNGKNRGINGGTFVRADVPILTKTGYPSSVIDFSVERGLHPTQKPVALLEYLIRTYTNPGDLVLDNTMGSATLPVACLNTGRRFIGIEKDDSYFEVAVNRVRDRELELASTLDL